MNGPPMTTQPLPERSPIPEGQARRTPSPPALFTQRPHEDMLSGATTAAASQRVPASPRIILRTGRASMGEASKDREREKERHAREGSWQSSRPGHNPSHSHGLQRSTSSRSRSTDFADRYDRPRSSSRPDAYRLNDERGDALGGDEEEGHHHHRHVQRERSTVRRDSASPPAPPTSHFTTHARDDPDDHVESASVGPPSTAPNPSHTGQNASPNPPAPTVLSTTGSAALSGGGTVASGAGKKGAPGTDTLTPVKGKSQGSLAAGVKSRKSSCDLCHHRKIRCDQGRPACGSCVRKGHVCRYSDDVETPPAAPSSGLNRSITIRSPSNPSERVTMSVPSPVPSPAELLHSQEQTQTSGRAGPGWSAVGHGSGLPTPTSGVIPPGGPYAMEGHRSADSGRRVSPSATALGSRAKGKGDQGGKASKGAKGRNQRERILNGFDSDSDDAGEDADASISPPGTGTGTARSGDAKGHMKSSGAGRMEVKQEPGRGKAAEVDELDSDQEEGDGGVEHDGDGDEDGRRGSHSNAPSVAPSKASAVGSGKRTASGDEELNGELLELASGPPPKKKKSRPSAPTSLSGHPTARSAASAAGGGYPRHHSSHPQSHSHASHASTHAQSHSSNNHHRSRQSMPAATHYPGTADAYTSSVQSLLAALPSADMQRILFDTFFNDPFLSEGILLLQPQFLEDLKSVSDRKGFRAREGDATTLANAFAFLATALRILPEETSRLLLASSTSTSGHAQPRSLSRMLAPQLTSQPDSTPLDQRYFDLALLGLQLADAHDSPSVMLVLLKLVLYRFVAIRRDKTVLAGQYLSGAVRVAQALGMGKEWEGIPQGERELRRRVMWCLYIADRQLSFETAFPYSILDAHQGIHLPSPISEADLYKIPLDAQALPPHSTEVGPTPCTALFIHTHLARRITPILDSFATISPSHTPHDLVLRFDQSLDGFQEALPPYMRLFPHTDTRFDGTHGYLAPHRIRLHAILLSYRQGVHRSFIPTYLRPSAPAGIRGVMGAICLSALRTQRSAKMLDPKLSPRIFNPLTVFESGMILALMMHVDKLLAAPGAAAVMGAESMAWREGIAMGMELLDGSGDEVALCRRAVSVMREFCVVIDGPLPRVEELPPNGARANASENGDIPLDESAPAPAAKAYAAMLDRWLDTLVVERLNMEFLLRDPQWEGAWERVAALMTAM